jgi:biopolymer transport protein ExbB/TolQ
MNTDLPNTAGGIDILTLMLHASVVVQLVLLTLVAASVFSWAIILQKKKAFAAAAAEAVRRSTDGNHTRNCDALVASAFIPKMVPQPPSPSHFAHALRPHAGGLPAVARWSWLRGRAIHCADHRSRPKMSRKSDRRDRKTITTCFG